MGEIVKRATYNLCHPYKNIREDARNNYEILLGKCIFIMKNLTSFLFLKIFYQVFIKVVVKLGT
jgi:hypothetical protein